MGNGAEYIRLGAAQLTVNHEELSSSILTLSTETGSFPVVTVSIVWSLNLNVIIPSLLRISIPSISLVSSQLILVSVQVSLVSP